MSKHTERNDRTEETGRQPAELRVVELEKRLREAEATIRAQAQVIAELKKRIAELERTSHRQATPFACREHKAECKRPGRRAGQGVFGYRERPPAEAIDETKEAELTGCPDCGGVLADVKAHEQFVIDLPEVRPTTTRYVTYSGYCCEG